MSTTQITNVPNEHTPGEIGEQIIVSGTTYECVGKHTFEHYKGMEITYEWIILAGAAPDYVEDDELQSAINTALALAKQSGEFNGPKGDPGQPGAPGNTPQKGVDYFTESDKNEMIQAIYNQVVDGNEVAW